MRDRPIRSRDTVPLRNSLTRLPVCFVIPPLLVAAAIVSPSGVSAQSVGPDPSALSIALIGGGRAFTDEDMQRTYGTVPELGVRLILPFEPRAHFFLGVSHAFDDGDPYYGEPGFLAEDTARLRMVPLEVGVRTNTLRHSRHRMYLGVAVQYTHVSERIAGTGGTTGEDAPAFTGWGWGGRVLGGPEWRFGDGRTGAGIELSWNVSTVYAEHEYDDRQIGLTGLLVRAYLTREL